MLQGRQSSCFWGAGKSDTSKDWMQRWEEDEKLFLGWRGQMDHDDPRPNVKTPLSWGAVQAYLSEFKDGEMKTTARAIKDADYIKALIKEQSLSYAKEKNDFGKYYEDGFLRLLMKGTVVLHNTYLVRRRKVKIEKDPESLSDDEVESIVSDKKPVFEEKMVTDYDDVAVIPIRIEEFLMDESARCLRGPAFDANDCIWLRPMTIEQIESEFLHSKDPFVIKENIKKIKPCGNYNEASNSFFEPPSGVSPELAFGMFYYNKAKDKFCIVFGDVVLRDGPNPHPHKQLPFSMGVCYEFLDSPYGISIPAILAGLQGEDETLRNLILAQLKINAAPPLKIQERVYGQIVKAYKYGAESGMMLPVRSMDDAQWMQPSTPSFEYANIRRGILEDAIVASGVDPRRQGLPVQNATATDAMMNKEATQKLLKKVIKNYVETIQDSDRQISAEMDKNYKAKRLKRITNIELGDEDRVERSILTEGSELIFDEDRKRVMSKDKKGRYSFTLRPEFFDYEDEIEIFIDPEQVVKISQGLEMRKTEQAIVDLQAYAGDPSATPPGQPGPLIDIRVLLKEYLETHNLNPKALVSDSPSGNPDEDVKWAIEQTKKMFETERVPGRPGESQEHLLTHQYFLEDVSAEIQKASENVSSEEEVEALNQMIIYQQLLAAHLAVDSQPASMAIPSALSAAQPPQEQAMPQQPGGPGPQTSPTGAGPSPVSQPGSPLGGTQGPTQEQVMGSSKPQPQFN